ncbi:LacI family DNA-binding transcriptional regulator [Caproicibacter fermentans]|uniref:LacI family DNA-binding transcriptional regulator n=1 Tax=Caproicibacter fermentans TaxID=2576756 RepID=A0A7G8T9Q9_9FIRM|nr:LacI family DNA-binding transcriptional regulator [Caproicibacter fermentans]QNK40350.1 LacI family DNA-binding transcriptional regulator [Caproicibacter fermentans]
MTLKNLAQLAGVSISTVSRVVNKNDSSVASKEVRDRIWDLARQTGYVPNRSAQNLKLGNRPPQTEAGRHIACIFARTPNGKSDPFFSQIFRSIEYECMKNRYEMTGVYTALNLRSTVQSLSDIRYDGIVVLGRYSRSLMNQIKRCSKSIVYTGLNPICDPYDQIICDGYETAKAAVRYLHTLGHTCIGYLGEKSDEIRYRGYYDAIQELRLPLRREHIVEAEQTMQGGYLGGKRILTAVHSSSEFVATRPTAIFCANDSTAMGVMKAFHEEGVRVPKEISIISIDNTEICQFTSPMLTAIHIPKDELGKIAAKILIDRMEGGHSLPMKIEIPFTLVTRESCASPLH